MKLPFIDSGKGFPVVLIHAFPLSKEMWKEQSNDLVRNGYRVILPDLPGFGDNESISYFTIEEMAEQINELVGSLNIKKAIIGGLSMGGYVALSLLRLNPDLFSALILCDTTQLSDTNEKRKARFELISKIEDDGTAALKDNMLANLISDSTKLNNPSLYSDLKNEFSAVSPIAAINSLKSLAERQDQTDLIENLLIPTLLIFGEYDEITDQENARLLKQLIPNSELVIIKNAGHYSNLEQPQQFNSALLKFCRNIPINE
jgi:pimeloyl-ACP methyl ester carboxylesterase